MEVFQQSRVWCLRYPVHCLMMMICSLCRAVPPWDPPSSTNVHPGETEEKELNWKEISANDINRMSCFFNAYAIYTPRPLSHTDQCWLEIVRISVMRTRRGNTLTPSVAVSVYVCVHLHKHLHTVMTETEILLKRNSRCIKWLRGRCWAELLKRSQLCALARHATK